MSRRMGAAVAVVGMLAGLIVGAAPVSAAPAGDVTVFSKVIAGKCPAGTVKRKAPRTGKVVWQWRNGNVSKKTVRKGKPVCVRTVRAGDLSRPLFSPDGTLVGLPINFPKNPTVADIKALGLTKDTPVAPGVRIPKPEKPSAGAVLPDRLQPVRVWTGEERYLVSLQDSVETYGTRMVLYTEWEATGGEGVFEHFNSGVLTYTSLSPETSVRVVTTTVPEFDPYSGTAVYLFHGGRGIAPDFGQGDLPPSTVQDWDQRGQYAQDKSGIGDPMSKRFNPSTSFYGVPRDGTAQINQNYTLVGNYNW